MTAGLSTRQKHRIKYYWAWSHSKHGHLLRRICIMRFLTVPRYQWISGTDKMLKDPRFFQITAKASWLLFLWDPMSSGSPLVQIPSHSDAIAKTDLVYPHNPGFLPTAYMVILITTFIPSPCCLQKWTMSTWPSSVTVLRPPTLLPSMGRGIVCFAIQASLRDPSSSFSWPRTSSNFLSQTFCDFHQSSSK